MGVFLAALHGTKGIEYHVRGIKGVLDDINGTYSGGT